MNDWVGNDAGLDPQLVLGHLGDIAVLVAPDGSIVGCNHVTASALGRPADEVVGQSIFTLIHPDDADLAVEQYRRYAEGDEIFRPTLRLGRPDGTAVPAEFVARRIERPDGTYLALSGRIAPLVNAEDLVDSLRIGVLLADADGVVTRANVSASELLGLAGTEPRGAVADVGGRFFALGATGGPPAEHPLLVALREQRVVHDRMVLEGADGTRRVVELEAWPVTVRFAEFAAAVMTMADVTDRHEADMEVQRRATEDDLTGVLNRTVFMARVAATVEALPAGQRLGLLFCDIDRFKSINERFGHSEADSLLAVFGGHLQELVGARGHVGRLGGDEFALAVAVADLSELDVLATRLRSAIRRAGLATIHVAVTSSVGISSTGGPRDEDVPMVEVGTLIEEADEALRRAKRSGRDRGQFFDADMRAQRARQTAMGRLLRDRLDAGQVEVAVQPVVAADTGRVAGGEVLARIRDDDGALIDAGRWIESAVRTGLIGAVDEAVTLQAAELLGELTRRDLGEVPIIGVNFADATLARPDLSSWLLELLAAAGADPTGFLVEIPETVFPVIRDRAAEALHHFKASGVWIAVDDFGIGYASLAEVRDLPIDTLKIDRSFVTARPGSGEEAVLRASVEMARALDCRVVAEGVETAAQLQLLAGLGVTYVQGYLLGRPMPAPDFVDLVVSGEPVVPVGA